MHEGRLSVVDVLLDDAGTWEYPLPEFGLELSLCSTPYILVLEGSWDF